MLQVDEDDAAEGGIAEQFALLSLLGIHPFVVVVHHLLDYRISRIPSLQDDMAYRALPACPACHLLHELESPFIAAEVGLREHRVGRKDANQADAVEVKALRHHLCADEDVRLPLLEIMQNLFVVLP